MDALTLRACRADEPAVRALIETHFALMRSQSPEESCHVLPAAGLTDIFMIAAEQDGTVLGIGALAQVDQTHGEIKSMHTSEQARGKGIARQVLSALIEEARRRGVTRVSLETGSAPEFTAARDLYRRAGFDLCPPFGTYRLDPLSVFMTRTI